MSKNVKNEPGLDIKPDELGLAKLSINLDLNSVVAIKVAEVERNLLLKRDKLQKEIASMKETLASDKKRFVDAMRAETLDMLGEKVNALNEAFKWLPATASFSIVLANTIYLKEPKKVQWEFATRGFHSYDIRGTFDASDALTKMDASNAELVERITELGAELARVMRNLSELSSVERQVRASIAEDALMKTAEGRKMLNMIDRSKPEKILGTSLH